MTAALANHSISGSTYTHTPTTGNISVTVPDVETVNGGYSALIDMTFLSIDGERWELYPVRIQ